MGKRDLQDSAITGIKWRTVAYATGFTTHFLSVIIIARFLTPAEVGIYVAAASFLEPLTLLSQFGLSVAIVQTPHLSRELIASAARFGVVFALLVWLLSSTAAHIVVGSEAAWIFTVLTTAVIINGTAAAKEGFLLRHLRLGTIARAEVAANAAYFCCTIGGASLGWGSWALVGGTLAQSASKAAVLLALSDPHVEVGPQTAGALRRLLRYGFFATTSRLVYSLSRNVDTWVISTLLGTAVLGVYNRGFRIARLPSDFLISVVGSVTLPTFSRLQEDRRTLGEAYLRAVRLSLLVAAPISVTVLFYADVIVRVLLGAAWSDAIPVVRIMAALGALEVVSKIADDVLRSVGRLGSHNRIFLLNGGLILVLSVLAANWGIAGIAGAVTVTCGVRALSLHRVALNEVGLARRELLAALVPGGAVACAFSGLNAAVLWTSGFLFIGSIAAMGIGMVGAVVLSIVWIAWGPCAWLGEFKEAINLNHVRRAFGRIAPHEGD